MAVTPELLAELETEFLPEQYAAGLMPFEYRYYGRSLAGSLCSPQIRIFRTTDVKVTQPNHGHKFTVAGKVYRFRHSLIHDDLPSMDDDELRRGRPTCHVRYDEATAILAGDALQSLAFQAIAEHQLLEPQTRVRLITELSRAAGTPHGMVAGQALDIEAEAREVTSEELEEIHRLKTAALVICAVRCGAIIAGANETELDAVTKYAQNLGLLFQITDDLLDVTATEQELGKTPGKDARSEKATYPALYGLEEARTAATKAHYHQAGATDRLAKGCRIGVRPRSRIDAMLV